MSIFQETIDLDLVENGTVFVGELQFVVKLEPLQLELLDVPQQQLLAVHLPSRWYHNLPLSISVVVAEVPLVAAVAELLELEPQLPHCCVRIVVVIGLKQLHRMLRLLLELV